MDDEAAALAEVSDKEILIEIYREARSIRRMLMWWLIIVPALLAVGYVLLSVWLVDEARAGL